MARRRYLLAYDISDDKRLRAVHGAARRFGYPLQYSLFVCDLDGRELVSLKWRLGEIIVHNVDRVAIIDLGSADGARFEFMGVHPRLPDGGPTIV